jgi:Ammonium Transporter Family
MIQLKGIVFVAVFAPLMTLLIFTALKVVFGSLRVSEEEEFEGLDLSQHSESAYALGPAGSMIAEIGSSSSTQRSSLVDTMAKPGEKFA